MEREIGERSVYLELEDETLKIAIKIEFRIVVGVWEFDPHLGVTYEPDIKLKGIIYKGVQVSEKSVMDFLWDMHFDDVSNAILKEQDKNLHNGGW